MSAEPLRWTTRTVTLGEVPLGLHLAGDDPELPLIGLIHGLEDRWTCWQAIAEALAPRARLVAFDMPWSGEAGYEWFLSAGPEALFAAALEAAGEVPRFFLTHSMGANVLLDYLTKHEHGAIEGVVLISPFYKPRFKDFGANFLQEYAQGFTDMYAEGLVVQAKGRVVAKERIAELASRVHLRTCPLGFLAFLKLFTATPTLALARLTLPVWLLGGSRDRMSSPADVAALAARLPTSTLRLEPDCGHYLMLERPAAVLEAIEALLAAPDAVPANG